MELHLSNEADTERLGNDLAELTPDGIVCLDGTLGAGKTRLVRAFATSCGADPTDVTSPTFTLWQTYLASRTIHHLDAYRIKDDDEFYELGVEELFDAPCVVFIEWANRIENCLPTEGRLQVSIEVISECERNITLEATDSRVVEALSKLQERWGG